MEIGYVVTDAVKWKVDAERDASEFDAGYYKGLLEKAWDEVAFVLRMPFTCKIDEVSPCSYSEVKG
jgi:hypothetical protein